MEQYSNLPFFRKFAAQLISLFLVFIVLLALFSAMFYQRDNQLKQILESQIPQFKKQQRFNQFIIKSNMLFETTLASKSAKELYLSYQKINTNFADFADLRLLKNKVFNELISENISLNKIIERINKNNLRNTQYKQNTLIQLQIIIDSLSIIIEDKSTIKSKDKENTLDTLIPLRQMLQSLNKLLVDFRLVDLYFSLHKFDAIKYDVEQVLLLWPDLFKTLQSLDNTAIESEIVQLNNLLFTEQIIMAKWRDHLLLAQSVVKNIEQQKKLLDQLATENNEISFKPPAFVPEIILKIASKGGFSVSPSQYRMAILISLIIGVVVFIYLLVQHRRTIKINYIQKLKIHDGLTFKEKSVENKQAEEHIPQLNDTEQCEKQEQPTIDRYPNNLSIIAQQNGVVFWQYTPNENMICSNKLLNEFMATQSDADIIESWRTWFDKPSILALLSLAKTVKKMGGTQSCSLKTRFGKNIGVTLNKDDNKWFGTVCDDDKLIKLKQTVRKLKKVVQKLKTPSIQTAPLSETPSNINLVSISKGKTNNKIGDNNEYKTLSKLLLPANTLTDVVFDLQKYTINQGSIELAVYMLEEHLNVIQYAMHPLKEAIANENKLKAQDELQIILKTAQIMAAEKLQDVGLKLREALSINNFVNSKILFDKLQEQQALLVSFSEAI